MRVVLEPLNQVREALCWKIFPPDDQIGLVSEQSNGLETAGDHVDLLGVAGGRGGDARLLEQKRVAVGCGFYHAIGAGQSAHASGVLDPHRLPQLCLHCIRHGSGDDVRTAAACERHNKCNGP